MTFEQAFANARAKRDDEAALSDLARVALAEEREDAVVELVRAAAERSNRALLWQWTALLERSLDEHGRAAASFDRAAGLAPADRSIAHGRARIRLEAGLPAQDLYREALRLAPTDGEILLGYAAALFADGQLKEAEATIDRALLGSPLWVDGHIKLAQLRSRMGQKAQAAASIERALQLQPRQAPLWDGLLRMLMLGEQFDALDDAIARARRQLPNGEMLLSYEAIAAVELGDTARADRLFAAMSAQLRRVLDVYWVRHLLRSGRLTEACATLDEAQRGGMPPNLWPYASVAWRMTDDPRSAWLEGQLDRFISVVDLTPDLPELRLLGQTLERLHLGQGEYLDQSVRGGSQTDGPLFTRVDPTIRALRAAVVGAVERHVRNLPARDDTHPLLAPPRDRRVRFSGSWSVLLRGGGFHAEHVHPQGWISSALYVRLPARTDGDAPDAGWLTLGAPQATLGTGLTPFRTIEPKPGQLVLFPSTMWHGTRPFSTGERLTVAFDIKPPAVRPSHGSPAIP